jgi:hypothetical protein
LTTTELSAGHYTIEASIVAITFLLVESLAPRPSIAVTSFWNSGVEGA